MMRALALAGPTATGKSRLALAVAESVNGEIISVDSGAVYRAMDIGTAKPSLLIRSQTPHHLIDVCNPDELFSVGQFCRLARQAVEDIFCRGKVPIFVGGSMMYYRALRDSLHELPIVSPSAKATIRQDMKTHGALLMHHRLSKLDKKIAAKILPSDTQRIGRALEIIYTTGTPMSDLLEDKKPPPFIDLSAILLFPNDRGHLRGEIKTRLESMFERGLIAETQMIMQKFNLTLASPPLRMAGYKQAARFLCGEYDEKEAITRAYYATCQLAKRQITWMRKWRAPLAIVDPFAADSEKKILDVAASNNS